MADSKVDTASLQALLDAFNAHDVFDVIPDVHYGDDRHWTSRSAAATCSSSSTARSAARTHSGDRRLTRFPR
jgi:hypothetical protein